MGKTDIEWATECLAVRRELVNVKAQRDELLAACKKAAEFRRQDNFFIQMEDGEWLCRDEILETLDAAIATAQGQ